MGPGVPVHVLGSFRVAVEKNKVRLRLSMTLPPGEA
jgi:hypothetical protein